MTKSSQNIPVEEFNRWHKYIPPLIIGLVSCLIVTALSELDSKYTVLTLLTLTAVTILLTVRRIDRLRSLMLGSLGFFLVINPNFFFYLVPGSLLQFAGVTGYGVAMTDLILVILAVLTLLKKNTNAQINPPRIPLLLLGALGLYLLWILLSFINAPDHSLASTQAFFEFKNIFLFLLIGYVVVPPGEEGFEVVNKIVFGLALGALVETMLAVAEYSRLIPRHPFFHGGICWGGR